ncbi:transglycosylase associated protein [Streptococcus pneumoniae SPN034183]|nr:transglycosylase associated protein [Streptococcus pneumoniae SPN034183]
MLGSMFVGLLVGIFSRCYDQSWRANGMFWKNVSRLDRSLSRSLALWNLGASFIRNSYYPSCFRCHDCLSYFLETRKLIS